MTHRFSVNNVGDSDYDYKPLLSDNESIQSIDSMPWNSKILKQDRVFRESNHRGARHCCRRNKKRILIGTTTSLGVLFLCAIIGIILTFAMAPKLVQNTVNAAKLTVHHIELSNPTQSTVWLSCIGDFDKSSPVNAILASSRMSLFYKGSEIGYFQLPDISLKASKNRPATSDRPNHHRHNFEHPSLRMKKSNTPVAFSSKLDILNHTSFADFAHDMIQNKQVVWTLSGKTVVTVPLLFNLRVHVNIHKDVTITGLDGLNELSVTNVNFLQSTNEDIVMNAIVNIQNPSAVAIEPVGDLNLDVFYQGFFMGTAKSQNASITAGLNQLPVKALIKPSNLNLASTLISDFLSSRSVNISVQSGYGNVTSIPLYNDALQGLIVNTSFIQTPPIQLIPQLNVADMKLRPLSNNSCAINVTLIAVIDNPLGPNCPLIINNITVNVTLKYKGLPTGYFQANSIIDFQNTTTLIANVSTTFMIDRNTFVDSHQIGSSLKKMAFVQMLEDIEHLPFVDVQFEGLAEIGAFINALGDVDLRNLLVNTSTQLKGLNNLPGTTLVELDVPGNATGPLGSGLAVVANGTLFNPSVISMDLGDVAMDMFTNNTYMGRVFCSNLSLKPGLNWIQVFGTLKPNNINAAAVFFRQYLTGQNTSVFISGALPTTSIPSSIGQKTPLLASSDSSTNIQSSQVAKIGPTQTIDWLEQAILSLRVDATVPGRENYNAILDLIVVDLFMDFTPESGTPIANGTMKAIYDPPFEFDFNFINSTIAMFMSFDDLPIAHMFMPWRPIVNFRDEKAFEVTVSDLPVNVVNATQFARFLTTLFILPHTTAGLSGNASANVDTNMGIVPISDLPFGNILQLNGTNRFQDPPVAVKDLNLVGGEPGKAYISLQLNITNPSSASLFIGKLVMSLIYNDVYIGNGTIPQMSLRKGLNTFKVDGIFLQLEENMQVGREFLSTFIQGHSINVTLRGTLWSTNITILKDAMSHLDTPATLPGFEKKLITFAHLKLDWSILRGLIPAQLTIYNPFDATINMIYVDVNVTFNGTVIATITQNLTDNPIVAIGHQTSLTPVMYGKIEGFAIDLIQSLYGTVLVDVVGVLGARVGTGFETTLDYVQRNIPASFTRDETPS